MKGINQMAEICSIRDFHSQLADVCSSLESLFQLAGSQYSEIESAASPAMIRFRELLDAGDAVVGPDEPEICSHT